MFVRVVLILSIASICATSDQKISVITMQVDLATPLTIFVSNYVEYILEFRPRAHEVGRYRVRVSSDGGDESHPVLLVLRQDNGARTWQLPYKSGERTLYETERTLCSSEYTNRNATDCGGVESAASGLFSLHVSSRCERQLRVSVLAYTTRHLLLLDKEHSLTATLTAAAVAEYRWSEGQRGVLLQAASQHDVCGAIVLQPSDACPVEEYTSEVSLFTQRMSMLLSGGVHVERKQFPNGFLVVSMVYPDDVKCKGVETEDEAWLWEDALLAPDKLQHPHAPRNKTFLYTITEAISLRQYWLSSLATLGAVALFYVVAATLVLLQRWPAWSRLVPRAAILLDDTSHTQPDNGTTLQRNIDTETLDGSDVSDTDSEGEGEQTNANNNTRDGANHTSAGANDTSASDNNTRVGANNQITTNAVTTGDTVDTIQDDHTEESNQVQTDNQNGEGTLRLTALSRRRMRTLKARADRYPPLLLTVCVFYSLPVLQLLAALQLLVTSSGSLDLCYYNFLCAWRAGKLHDFNHVISNLAYLLLGALLLLHLWRRRALRKRSPPHPDYGIPEHYGLLAALGLGMMTVALMSGAYHVCPNRLNFQFDTAFMYVLSVLINVKLYQARHPDINARAHATFAALAFLIALAVWGVLGESPLFWALFTVLHVFTVLLLSLQVYYIGQFKFEKPQLPTSRRQLLTWRLRYKSRALALAVANFANWALAIYGLTMSQNNFASHLLNVLLGNALFHMAYYLLMKLVHKERLKWYSTVITVAAMFVWIPAMYFFIRGNSEWALPPAQSRHYNHRCLLLQFYDAHDLWHLLSAVALYLSFCAILTWDDGLSATPRHQIPVF